MSGNHRSARQEWCRRAGGQTARQSTAAADSSRAWSCMPPALTGESCVTWRLADYPAELGHARELVRKALAAWGLGEQAELAELVVTELATNALRHGTGPIDISLSHSGNDLRTGVHDHGAGRPVRRRTTADDEQGRGLELLDGLIDLNGGARGVVDDTDGPGKTVYVALSLDSGQASTG
jgi:anti-sigma regulatory factor (Ser/Thr protein kinase)